MKKFLQKAFAMLVLCLVSMSAMAQDVTIQLKQWNSMSTNQNYATDGVRVTYSQDGMGQSEANIYRTSWPLTVTAENEKNIAKVVLSKGRSLTGVYEKDSKGSMTSNTAASCTWEAGAGQYTLLTFVSTTDCYAGQIDIWFVKETPSEPIDYSVDFVNAPNGAAVTIKGEEYTRDDSFSLAEILDEDDVTNVVEPIGYQANVAYDEVNHIFTITYVTIPAIKNGTEWTTMTLDSPFSLGDGYVPYIVKGVSNGVLDIEEVPAGFGPKLVDFNFEGNAVSQEGNNLVVANMPDDLSATLSAAQYSGVIQTGYLFGYSEYGDNVVISVPNDYSGEIKYVEVVPYPGQSVTWKFDAGSFTTTEHYEVNAKSVKVTFGGAYYYYIRHIRVCVEGPDAPIIPANEGILVHGTTNTNIPYTYKADATPSDVTGNLLVGCTVDATWNTAGKTYYKFSLDADNTPGTEGFYWGVDGGASIEAHAGKAYLVLDAASSNRFLINGFGEETGINAIATESNDAIFNLQGQRVNATATGIYVKNGKKFIVK